MESRRHLPVSRASRVIISKSDPRFSTAFPLELETRLDAATYTKFIEQVNAPLREAYSTSGAVVDNLIGVLTWWTSLIWRTSHFEKVGTSARAAMRAEGGHGQSGELQPPQEEGLTAGTAARRGRHPRG